MFITNTGSLPYWNNCCELSPLSDFLPKTKEVSMTNVALFVRIEAKKGKEAEVQKLLQGSLSIVENEQGTVSWYALRLGPTTFGIFDTFNNNEGREAHLNGEIAKALKKRTPELFAQPPTIERVDILASKLPEMAHH